MALIFCGEAMRTRKYAAGQSFLLNIETTC
jgi:hypothetical protein